MLTGSSKLNVAEEGLYINICNVLVSDITLHEINISAVAIAIFQIFNHMKVTLVTIL